LDTVIFFEDDSGGSDDSILRFPDENKVRVGQGTDVGWRCTKRDGRNGHVGYKDVLAHLPDDDALQAKDEVFRPIFSVARKEGNCALDDLSENVMIGSDRKQNLKMALYAIVESKPTSIDVDKIKTLASQINARSFYNRVMKAQRTAALTSSRTYFSQHAVTFYRSSYVKE
jgi:hypothetical protein